MDFFISVQWHTEINAEKALWQKKKSLFTTLHSEAIRNVSC